ncbi:MAG: hypothetical protein HKN87_02325 [Saprospiraceae bacterium]|nr:hypothetical protein [Saprospiraceae bacterium]
MKEPSTLSIIRIAGTIGRANPRKNLETLEKNEVLFHYLDHATTAENKEKEHILQFILCIDAIE